MSKTLLRFLIASLWLCGASAFAQDITVTLSPAQVAEIMRLVDLQPQGKALPDAYWDIQIKLGEALKTNPAAMRAYLSAGSAAR